MAKKWRKKPQKLSAYEVMWVIVMFDLPTVTRAEKSRATTFRYSLLGLGFSRKQFSVYMRHAVSLEKAKTIAQKVKHCLVPNGFVSVLYITDRQYGMVENFFGPVKAENEADQLAKQEQLSLF